MVCDVLGFVLDFLVRAEKTTLLSLVSLYSRQYNAAVCVYL